MGINKESGLSMFRYAMNYGVILGTFWVFKYCFLIASSFWVHFIYIYSVLTVGTLLLYYVLLRRYRDNALGGSISYLRCIAFSVLLFFFSAMIEAVVIYVHYKFIDTTYFLTKDKSWLEMLLQSIFSRRWLESQRDNYGTIIVLISEIIKNVVIGFFLSMVYGIFVKQKESNDESNE